MIIIGITGSIIRLFGFKTNISYTNMKIICTKNYYKNEKATKDLNLNFKPIEIAINDAVKWFTAKKMIKE